MLSAPPAFFTVLVVASQPSEHDTLAQLIRRFGGRTVAVDHGQAAMELMQRERPDVILADRQLSDMTGLQLLEAMEGIDQPPPLALMAAEDDAETAIVALRLGAVGYLHKPVEAVELERFLARLDCMAVPRIPTPIPDQPQRDGLLVVGPILARVVAMADRFHAATDQACLIEGETGTEVELLARRLHHGGQPGNTAPFVVANCARSAVNHLATWDDLIGHGGKPAVLVAQAHGGTLFVQAVDELPMTQQAALSELLQRRGTVQVRLVCGTNHSLADAVASGQFHADLYQQLNARRLRIPPLRERVEEIVPLAHVFMQRIRMDLGHGFQKMSSGAEAFLMAQNWPGNAQQLYQLLEQAARMYDGAVLDARHVSELMPEAKALVNPPISVGGIDQAATELTTLPPLPTQLQLPDGGLDLDAWTAAVVKAALLRNDGSPVRTAIYLGLTRKVLYTLRKRYGLLHRSDG